MRKVLLHYHLFKNAGSSVDEFLRSSFGDRWINWDKPDSGAKILASELAAYIDSHPDLQALSSHQAMPPLPKGSFEVFPIVFLRNPILRARSAYLFEWQHQPRLRTPRGTFAEYVEEKLATNSGGAIANFHVYQLANLAIDEERPRHHSDPVARLEQAKLFVTNLPVFGLVEQFSESLKRFHFYLKYHFPALRIVNYHVNVSQGDSLGVEGRITKIREELGENLYSLLVSRNTLDLELYRFACERFGMVIPSA